MRWYFFHFFNRLSLHCFRVHHYSFTFLRIAGNLGLFAFVCHDFFSLYVAKKSKKMWKNQRNLIDREHDRCFQSYVTIIWSEKPANRVKSMRKVIIEAFIGKLICSYTITICDVHNKFLLLVLLWRRLLLFIRCTSWMIPFQRLFFSEFIA